MYYADKDGALKTESWLDYSQLELKGLEELNSDISGRIMMNMTRCGCILTTSSKR